MQFKVKSGIIVKIPHLKGKSEEDANNLFKTFGNTYGYNMRLIGDDWYLEQPGIDKNSVDDTHNTAVTGYTLTGFTEFADQIIKALETIEPEYYKKLENWCNPQAYFFIGDWKDVNKAYACLTGLNKEDVS